MIMKSITGEGTPDGLQCVINGQSGCWGCGARELLIYKRKVLMQLCGDL